MKEYKVLFCDLDGTLIETINGNTFPKGIWDMKFKFDVLDAIKKLTPEYVFIVSNQGGIEKGLVNESNFIKKMKYIKSSISEYLNIDKDKILFTYCPTNDIKDSYRKPNTHMLEHCLYFSDCPYHKNYEYVYNSLMIGDASGLPGQFSDSDKKTAENFRIDYLDVNEFVNIYK